jgi:hypothetical protein
MTTALRHRLRLVMRAAYTLTGFFTGIMFAAIAHDGLALAGGLLPAQSTYLLISAVCWAIALFLDGWTSEPGHR